MNVKNITNNYNFFCLSIFVFLSLILFFQVPDQNRLELDSQLYDRIAKNFADNSDLSDPINPKIMPVTAMGYPLFMGLVFKVFGINYKIIVLLQILFSIFCFFLIYNICLKLFNKTVANIALFLSCINLGFIIHSQFILTEILLVTFLLLFFYYFSEFILSNNFYYFGTAGFFLGVSILVKPVAIFFLPVPVLLIFINKKSNFINKLKKEFIFLLIFMIPVFGYIFFNYKKYNIIALNPAGYENIYRYYLPRVLACKNNISLESAQIQVDKLVTDNNNINLRYGLELQNLLIKTCLSSPLIAISVWIRNMIKTYFGLYTTELKVLYNQDLRGGLCSYFKMSGTFFEKIVNYVTFGTNSRVIKIIGFWEIFYLLAQYILIFFACYSLFLNKQFNILFLLLSFIIYFALITGHDGFGRYRMIFEPALIILNSIGVFQLFKLFFKQEKYA